MIEGDDDPIDDRIRAYYELQGQALRLFEGEARDYAERCDCGKRERTKDGDVVGRRLGPMGDQVCIGCQAVWPFVMKIIPRGEVQKSGRPQAYENRLASLAPLGYALNQMLADTAHWRWATQVLVSFCLTIDYWEIAKGANIKAWPHPRGGEWTEQRAEMAANAARRELRKRMRR